MKRAFAGQTRWKEWGRTRWGARSLWGRFAGAMVLLITLSAFSTLAVTAYIFQTQLTLVFNVLPPASQELVKKRLAQIESHHDPATNFDLPNELIALAIAPVLISVVLAFVLARRIARPLEGVALAARAVAQGHFEARAALSRRAAHDEVNELARDFNAMAQALETLEQERLGAAAAVAHELRAPLTVLRAHLQAAMDGVLPFNLATTALLLRQTLLLARLVEDLQMLSLAEAGHLTLQLELCQAGTLTALVLEPLRPLALSKRVELEGIGLDSGVQIEADPLRLAQVLTNLLENALRHTPEGSRVRIELKPQQDQLHVVVEDQGPGFRESDLRHVFGSFYQSSPLVGTPPLPKGKMGLGLSIVRAVVTLHGGTVWAENTTNGARVTVALPYQVDQSR